MSCLGERLTALVDGELGHEERDRALAHLALCERCRSEADTLRSLKGRLRGLGERPPADGADDLPSSQLMARLRGLGEPDDPAPARPVQARRPMSPRPVGSRPRDNRPASRAAVPRAGGADLRAGATAAFQRPSRRYLAVGAATLVLGLSAASYAAGGQRETPSVSPAFDRFAVEHAVLPDDVPMTERAEDRTPAPSTP